MGHKKSRGKWSVPDRGDALCRLAVSDARVALPNFYNIAIRIANVAARLAVLRLYLLLFWHDRRFRIRSRRLRTATTTRSAAAASICSSRRRLSRSSVMRMRDFPSIEGKGILLQAAGLRAACASRKASSSRSHNAWSSPSGSGRQSRNFDEPGGNGFLGRHSAMGDRLWSSQSHGGDHEVSIRIAMVGAGGRWCGLQPGAKATMMRMRRPQHGQGCEPVAGSSVPLELSGLPCGLVIS